MDIDWSKIFIVSPEDMIRKIPRENEDYPNFVMAGGAQAGPTPSVAVVTAGSLLTALASKTAPFAYPLGLILAASVVSPAILSRLSKEKPEIASPLAEQEKHELESFLMNHAVTLQMVKEAGFTFPPGHPQIGAMYKRHPLADTPAANKKNVYIPQEKYDEILMAEREAELIKMLVHLGANKITITQNNLTNANSSLSGEVSLGGKGVGNASLGGGATSASSGESIDKREFVLSGKRWKEGDTLKRENFAWLNFEPSWEALVVAREVGGCTKAALEIRENTMFSTDKNFTAKVESAFYGGKVSGDAKRSAKEEKIYLIESEYAALLLASGANVLDGE